MRLTGFKVLFTVLASMNTFKKIVKTSKTSGLIREIVNIKNTISPKLAQLNIEGKIIVNRKEIATNLNHFFYKDRS